jgi:hypothetical protein
MWVDVEVARRSAATPPSRHAARGRRRRDPKWVILANARWPSRPRIVAGPAEPRIDSSTQGAVGIVERGVRSRTVEARESEPASRPAFAPIDGSPRNATSPRGPLGRAVKRRERER